VRLVTTGAPDAGGELQGALEIELKRRWKTYWRDPGDAGVPPTIDISASSNINGVELAFPVPERHQDGDLSWAGYAQSVTFPVAFSVADPTLRSTISAAVFLGICETICVPVSAQFTIDPQGDPDNPADAAIVSNAAAALPAPATADFGLRTVEAGKETLTVEAILPSGARASDVFIAADQGYYFQAPQMSEKEGKTYFTLAVTKPDERPSSGGLHYTLVTDHGAVSGILPFF
jgi:DsbC/DsbD-like thiol-disulfide interchange protein